MATENTPRHSENGTPTPGGYQKIGRATPLEQAFWEYAELYTGMKEIDMMKSSHGRAFTAGWLASLRSAARLLGQLHDAESLRSDPSGLKKRTIDDK